MFANGHNRESLKTVCLRVTHRQIGFHFTTWPNRNTREISLALLKISIPFLDYASESPGLARLGDKQ